MTDENTIQSNGLSLKENGIRLLAVLYAMSDGKAGVKLNTTDVLEECARVGVFKMTASEFDQYRLKSIAAAHVLDAEVIG